MNRADAQQRSAVLQQAACDGEWPWLLEQELPAPLLELLRQSAQLDQQIRHLEQQERLADELIVQNLMATP